MSCLGAFICQNIYFLSSLLIAPVSKVPADKAETIPDLCLTSVCSTAFPEACRGKQSEYIIIIIILKYQI